MRNKTSLLYFIFLVVFISCIKTSSLVERNKNKLQKQGYIRQKSSGFSYASHLYSDLEDIYYLDYLRKKNSTIKGFFDYPSVKDSILFLIGHTAQTYGKAKDGGCVDTIDVYIDGKLISTGHYPYTLGCRSNRKDLPTHPKFVYNNRKKIKQAHLSIIFRKDKIYFDTIIPLRFKKIIPFYTVGSDFFFTFEGALDSTPLHLYQK